MIPCRCANSPIFAALYRTTVRFPTTSSDDQQTIVLLQPHHIETNNRRGSRTLHRAGCIALDSPPSPPHRHSAAAAAESAAERESHRIRQWQRTCSDIGLDQILVIERGSLLDRDFARLHAENSISFVCNRQISSFPLEHTSPWLRRKITRTRTRTRRHTRMVFTSQSSIDSYR